MPVMKTHLPILWEEIPAYEISHALWNTTYQPKALARLAYIENDALYINMFVEEKNPKADYHKQNDPVYKDSCLECFINLNPLHQVEYLNIEVNANGAMLMGFGKDRHARQRIEEELTIGSFKNERGWGFTLILPIEFLKQFFTEIGHEWRGNFYKCGDETKEVHFLSWSEVKEEKPDFHCPQWFGKLTLSD